MHYLMEIFPIKQKTVPFSSLRYRRNAAAYVTLLLLFKCGLQNILLRIRYDPYQLCPAGMTISLISPALAGLA